MITRSAHPAWCESPNAPDDDTHTHTAAVGSVLLPGDITAEMVLAQMPRTPTPLLTLHVTGPARRISVDMTGVESWALAGVLIDATVAHRQAITDPAPPPMRDRSSTRGLDREPSWCEYPHAPNDATHAHTAAIGTAHLAEDATVEIVLVQAPDAACPMLALHLVTAAARVNVAVTGAEAWTLAGVLIDATVAHAHAVPGRSSATVNPLAVGPSSRRPERQARPLWLLDRHPNGRMPRARARRSFRCPPTRQPSAEDDLGRPEATE